MAHRLVEPSLWRVPSCNPTFGGSCTQTPQTPRPHILVGLLLSNELVDNCVSSTAEYFIQPEMECFESEVVHYNRLLLVSDARNRRATTCTPLASMATQQPKAKEQHDLLKTSFAAAYPIAAWAAQLSHYPPFRPCLCPLLHPPRQLSCPETSALVPAAPHEMWQRAICL